MKELLEEFLTDYEAMRRAQDEYLHVVRFGYVTADDKRQLLQESKRLERALDAHAKRLRVLIAADTQDKQQALF